MKMDFFAYDCFVLLFDFVALPRPNLVFYSFVCSKSPKSNTGLSILCNHSSTWLSWVDLHVNSLSWHKRKRACLQGFLVFRRPINFGKKYESRSCLVWQFLKCYIGRHSCFLSSSRLKRCRLHIFPYLFSHFLKRKSCPMNLATKSTTVSRCHVFLWNEILRTGWEIH